MQVVEVIDDVRAEPGLPGRALALERERPVVQAGPPGDELRRAEQLVLVGISHRQDPLRKRVRREDDVGVCPAHPVGQHVEERLVVVPALDEDELGAPVEPRLEPLAIAGDREPRVVRREHQAEHSRCAPFDGAIGGFPDPWPPVLHAEVDGNPELQLERGPLPLGYFVERRTAADAPVALGQLLYGRVGDGPALADVLEVRTDVLRRGGRAVRHEDDDVAQAWTAAVRSCTSSRSRRSSAGSVLGRTPWPRLKMWPGRPSAASRIASVAHSTRSHEPRSSAGSRLPWTPRSAPTRSQPSPSGIRQSRPITSPPAAAIDSRRCDVPVPKWIVGTESPPRIRSEYGATNSS